MIYIEGRLTDNPELRFTKSGIAVCSLRIAINNRKKDESGNWVDGEATYVTANVWKSMAENCADALAKGDLVLVSGKFKTRSYEDKNGDTKFVTEIDAETVGKSLRFGKRNGTSTTDNPWENAPF